MQIYRFLTEDDTSAFCHKVSAALAKGWVLYGDPQYTFDQANGVLRCWQSVVKDVDTPYSPDMKLRQQ